MLPAIPALLANIGLPVLTRVVGRALRGVQHPAAQAAADGLERVGGAVDTGEIPPATVADANRHIERMAELDSEDYRTTIREVNRTIRAEVASDDAYVRRMRPTFGYVMALTWTAQMGAIAWSIVADPQGASAVIADMASLSVIWTVGLSVLGIYVYKRSEEKRPALDPAGGSGAGLIGGLVQRLRGDR